MSIEAIKLVEREGACRTERTKLLTGGSAALLKAKEDGLPAAYIIRSKDLDYIRPLNAVVEDRGTKHRAKGLSKILLGRKKIQLIEGGFTSGGRLLSGVTRLLENARKKKENNLFIIGAEDALFDALHEEGAVVKKRRTAVTASAGSMEATLINLMNCMTVPHELENEFIGISNEARLVRQLILHAATIVNPVLILGDTGTGKEIVAREIHAYSTRSNRRLVPVNCGAIASELFESELFGHKRGAFTGALSDKKGLWREAGGGTLFLDEIGDLSLSHQAKILRALDEKKIRPVGDETEYTVDARIIAATNRDLFTMVQTGQFREDLYYRLRGFLIYTPPLRDHLEDVPLLARSIWKRLNTDEDRVLPSAIISELKSHRWPGNVREMKMVLSNLYGLFHPLKKLDVCHLKAVFMFRGQERIFGEDHRLNAKSEEQYSNIEALHHLRRAYEVILAAERAISPVVNGVKLKNKAVLLVRSDLRYRLDELETLCIYPLRFHDQPTFDKVNDLKSKLLFFESLLKGDTGAARKHWQKNAKGQFKEALSAVLEECEKVIRISCS